MVTKFKINSWLGRDLRKQEHGRTPLLHKTLMVFVIPIRIVVRAQWIEGQMFALSSYNV